MRCVLMLAAVSLTSGALISAHAQVSAPAAASANPSADAITAEGIARHLEVMAHDSMRSRETPSPGLMRTAQYVADQFQKLGLTPGGDVGKELDRATRLPIDTSWFQQYPIPDNLALNYGETRLELLTLLHKDGKRLLTEEGRSITKRLAVPFTNGARFAVDTVPESGAAAENFWSRLLAPPRVLIVAGKHTLATLQAADLQDNVVIYLPSPETDSTVRQQLFDQLYARNHVLLISEEDSVSFHDAATRRPIFVADRLLEKTMGVRRWAADARLEVLRDYLALATGVDLPGLRADSTPIVRELKGLRISLLPVLAPKSDTAATAVNVVGILEGTGPDSTSERWQQQREKSKGKWRQYVVISASMDNPGNPRGQRDTLHHGATEKASGIAGLIELAKAFTQLETRPQRSIVFLATSGSAHDFYGSTYWANAWSQKIDVVANLTVDPLVAPAGDTVVIDGMDDLTLPMQVPWIAAQHPALRLAVIDGGTTSQPLSDHFTFVRRAIPSLSFHNARDVARNLSTDSTATLDPGLEARMLKLAFHVAHHISTSDALPMWSTEGRRRRIQAQGE